MATTKTVTMELDRNYTVRSTLGHMITFKRNVPMEIPEVMVRSCAEIGAKRVDGKAALDVPEEQPANAQPVDPGHRLIDIREAVDKVAEMNARDDFTAGGTPTVSAVIREVGYRVDRTEVRKAWQQRNEDLANDTE